MAEIIGRRISVGGGGGLPDSWEYYTYLTQDTSWEVPADGWYRILLFGQCGSGGYGQNIGSNGLGGGGGAGGGSGGYACSAYKLEKGAVIEITCNTSLVSFGDEMSVTGGTNGGTNSLPSASANGGTGGIATGGIIANLNGADGGKSGNTAAINGTMGGNDGAPGGNGTTRSGQDVSTQYATGGGGGAALARHESNEKYLGDIKSCKGGNGGYGLAGSRATVYPDPFATGTPVLYGGGCGHGAFFNPPGEGNGFASNPGSPACVIIERGVK